MRQQRLGVLSQALRDAGIQSPDIMTRKKSVGPVPKDWDCVVGGEDEPTSCLIMGEVGRGRGGGSVQTTDPTPTPVAPRSRRVTKQWLRSPRGSGSRCGS